MKTAFAYLFFLMTAPLAAFAQDNACERYPQSTYDHTYCFS